MVRDFLVEHIELTVPLDLADCFVPAILSILVNQFDGYLIDLKFSHLFK